jgi:hypothetical protein
MNARLLLSSAVAIACALPVSALAQSPSTMRIAGNFSSNKNHVDAIERPFFTALPAALGSNMTVNYNPMDVVNVQAADALRLLRSGTFRPLMSSTDLIGLLQ